MIWIADMISPFSAVQALLVLNAAGHTAAGPASCPADAPVSCQNSSTIEDTCCTEVYGEVLQVQFWDANPATGPADSWTIHGLW